MIQLSIIIVDSDTDDDSKSMLLIMIILDCGWPTGEAVCRSAGPPSLPRLVLRFLPLRILDSFLWYNLARCSFFVMVNHYIIYQSNLFKSFILKPVSLQSLMTTTRVSMRLSCNSIVELLPIPMRLHDQSAHPTIYQSICHLDRVSCVALSRDGR